VQTPKSTTSNLGNRGLGQRFDEVSYVSRASTTLSTKMKMADLERQLEVERHFREKAEGEIKYLRESYMK